MSIDLSGVLVPCTTPFDPVTGEVDLVGFRSNVRSFLAHPVRGIVVGGSTGEAVLLEEDERMVLLEGARDLVPDDRLVVAGTGAESTRSTIRACIKDPDRLEEIIDLIEEGREQYGSQTFDQHLMDLVETGPVEFDLAKAAANSPSDFDLKMNMLGGAHPGRGSDALSGPVVGRSG